MSTPGGHAQLIGCITVLFVSGAVVADEPDHRVPAPEESDAAHHEIATFESLHRGPGAIDPVAFFEQVVQRYRTISAYEDQIHLVEVTTPEDGAAQRRETSLQCEITPNGELKIHSPAEALLQDFGIQLSLFGSSTSSLAETRRAYDLWQAPHMTLRFLDDPLHDLRASVRDGMQATRAHPVTVGKREMVQIELEGDANQDAQADTRVDLYVDPESMLVERVESREQLPDGATYETTFEIEPRNVLDEHGEVISRPQRETNPLSNEAAAPQQWNEAPQAGPTDSPAGSATPDDPAPRPEPAAAPPAQSPPIPR